MPGGPGQKPTMIRTLTAFVGFGLAAAILWFVPDFGDLASNSVWSVPLVWAAAGLVGALFYQVGGGLRLRPNVYLLAFVALPWTVLAAGLVAVASNDPVWIADRVRDILPDAWLTRWQPSVAAFAFASGALIAFGVCGPRRAERVAVVDEPAVHDEVAHDEVVTEQPVIEQSATEPTVVVGAPSE